MEFKTSLLFFSFLLLLCHAKAFNITNLLGKESSFSQFNDYLTQTQVASTINSRQTITVLVVDNGNLSPLSGKSKDVLANIMRLHVLLDYYDVDKLKALPNKTIKSPTLFQTTGQANDDIGYLNITDLGGGTVAMGSAAKGATLGSKLVKSVVSQPYNISILQISSVIVPQGIESAATAPSSSSPSHSPAHSPTSNNSSKPGKAPSPGSAEAPGSPPEPESPDEDTDTPPGSPPEPTDTPAADAPAADNSPTKSASPVIGVSLVFIAVLNMFLALITI